MKNIFPHAGLVACGLYLVLTLAGCASAPKPAPVPVPVAVKPTLPALPPKPALPAETLRANADADATIEALTQSLAAAVKYARALETYIEGLK